MKPKDLLGLLDNKISCGELLKNILPELEIYKRELGNREGIAPVCFPKKNPSYFVKNVQVKRLLEHYLDGTLDETAISYIASAMTISVWITFESEEIEDFVFLLSNLETNASLTKDDVARFIQNL